MYKVNEIFLSIQGEGILQGIPTVFIRFSGCNLNCDWCDTEYAREEGEEKSLGLIISEIQKFSANNVCITGGEPLLQKDLAELIRSLLENGYKVCIETNGSLPIKGLLEKISVRDGSSGKKEILFSVDVKTPSSGEVDSFEYNNLEVMSDGDQLKFIVKDLSDLIYVRDFLINRGKVFTGNIFIQPVDNKNLEELAEKFIQTEWPQEMDIRFGLQIHKIIWSPDTRGV